MISNDDISPYLSVGNPEKLVKFYNNNVAKRLPLLYANDNLVIMTYNVHGWININKNISINDNYLHIMALIASIDADIIVLQEVCFEQINYLIFLADINKTGYDHIRNASNGNCFHDKNMNDYIVVISKYPINNSKIINTRIISNKKFPERGLLIINIGSLTIAAVHLEIGKRYHNLLLNDPNRQLIIDENAANRIGQLEKMLEYNPDIIVGDFNFTPTDTEAKWLKKRCYAYMGKVHKQTTPYNCTDMLFLNSLTLNTKCTEKILSINLSDHLPVLYTIY